MFLISFGSLIWDLFVSERHKKKSHIKRVSYIDFNIIFTFDEEFYFDNLIVTIMGGDVWIFVLLIKKSK